MIGLKRQQNWVFFSHTMPLQAAAANFFRIAQMGCMVESSPDLFCNSCLFKDLTITANFPGCLAHALLYQIFKKIKLVKRKNHVDLTAPERLIFEETTGY
jgi:hypothetical protein